MKVLITVTVLFLAQHCLAYGSANHKSESVSLIRLIAHPEQYHGKPVRVIGVGRIEFEGNALCLSKEHYRYRVSKSCLWIGLDLNALGVTAQELSEWNGQYSLIEGIFDMNNTGHMGMNSGAIEAVSRYQLWE